MGAWDTDTFDNDTACDWGYELERAEDLVLVETTLARVLGTGDAYLESGPACEALAACEVVARLKGQWGQRNAYTETIDAWVTAHPATPPLELVERCVAALDRVLREPSELLELWNESEDGGASWRERVDDLRARVAS